MPFQNLCTTVNKNILRGILLFSNEKKKTVSTQGDFPNLTARPNKSLFITDIKQQN